MLRLHRSSQLSRSKPYVDTELSGTCQLTSNRPSVRASTSTTAWSTAAANAEEHAIGDRRRLAGHCWTAAQQLTVRVPAREHCLGVPLQGRLKTTQTREYVYTRNVPVKFKCIRPARMSED